MSSQKVKQAGSMPITDSTTFKSRRELLFRSTYLYICTICEYK